MDTFGSLKQIVLLLSFVFEITAGEKTFTKWLKCCWFWCSRGNTSGCICFSKTIFLALQSMYKNPRLRKVNSQTHTVLQVRLHFQSPLLADHILPVSLFLVLTCPSRSLFSSGLSSEAPSPSLLEAIDNLAVVAQDSGDGKTHHTHTVLSPEIGKLRMKKISLEHIKKRPGAVWDFSFRSPWIQTQSTSGYSA